MVAVDLLEESGRTVIEARCAEEAPEVLRTADHVDLLFTDIDMPGDLDGLDLAAIAYRRRPGLKLIVTSGGNTTRDDQLPDHGRFISKPDTPGALARLVEAERAGAC